MSVQYDHEHENEVTLFAETNFRNQRRRFGIRTDDRRRHIYVIGKTGMGKTTLLENMVLSDINAGHGVAYIDPHGDTAEKILDYIPAKRINDVVYFNPADMEYPVGFNILETANDEQKHLVASGLMGVFKKIWPDVWSPRMEYILLNCVLALLDYPGATLLGINRLLVDKEYRARVISKIRNPIVKTFWVAEFTSWSEKYATEAIAPVQNKVGQFLSASIIRNIVAQVKSSINPRQIMDEGKIFIVNLSKGKIGEDNMRLLGGMIVTKMQLAAMERVDIPLETDRRDFYLFVDEFQNFATRSFANILSEARKYRLNLTVAHQYIEQLEEEQVRDAVFGNVGTLVIFRVGAQDATFMETEFMPTYTPEDLTNLAKYQVYLKLMVDGVATAPFSANTLAPIAQIQHTADKVIAVSRERYAEPRAVIEEKVLRWSGMEIGTSRSALPVEGAAEEGGMTAVQYPKIVTAEEREAPSVSLRASLSEAEGASLGGVPASLKPGTPEYARAGIAALEGEEAVTETEEYLRISPERLAAIRPVGAKKDKPKFKHTCTRCGKVWDMPVQLDPSRPMYCSECLPIVREERKFKSKFVKTAVSDGAPLELSGRVEEAEGPAGAASAVLHERMRAVEEGHTQKFERPQRGKKEQDVRTSGRQGSSAGSGRAVRTSGDHGPSPLSVNRPRLVITSPDKLAELVDEPLPEERSALLEDVARAKGKTVETRKSAVMPPKEKSQARPEPLDITRDSLRRGLPNPKRVPSSKFQLPGSSMSPPVESQRSQTRATDLKDRSASRGGLPGNATGGQKTPKKSLEDVFREAEERTDQAVARPAMTEQSATVFKQTQATRPAPSPSLGAVQTGPKPIKAGERVRFDE